MKKLLSFFLLFVPAVAFSSGIYNPGSGTGGGGGGGASTLETIFGTARSSPTATIKGSSNFSGSVTGSTMTIDLATTLSVPSTLSISTSVVGANMHQAGFIVVQQHYAYLASNHGINIFDVANATSPVLLSYISTNTLAGDIEGMEISGKYLFAAAFSSNAIVAVDISKPAFPKVAGYLQDSANLNAPEQLRIVGNYAYVGCLSGNTFSVIDISTPTAMRRMSTSVIEAPLSVQIRYPYAYITDNLGSFCKMSVVDISNPSSTTILNTFTAPASCTGGFKGSDLYGRYMYAGDGNGAIYTMDISSPAAPVFISSVTTSSDVPLTVRAVGNYLYLSSIGTDSIVQYSLANPALPVRQATLTDATNLDGPDDLYFSGGYLYASTQGTGANGGFTIINLGRLSVPALVTGSLLSDELEITHDAKINRLSAGTSILSPFVGAVDLEGFSLHVTSNSNVAGSTFTYANNGQLAIGEIDWPSGATQTTYTPGITSPGTFTWQNTQGISVSTIVVTTMANTQIPYFDSSKSLVGSTNLVWDNANGSLNLGGASTFQSSSINIDNQGNASGGGVIRNASGGTSNIQDRWYFAAAEKARYGVAGSGTTFAWRVGDLSNDEATLSISGFTSRYGITATTGTFSNAVSISSNAVLAGTTFYQNGNVTIGTAGTVTIISSNAFIAGSTFYQSVGLTVPGLSGASLSTCGDSTHGLGWAANQFTCQSITGSGGSGTSFSMAIGTGTANGSSFAEPLTSTSTSRAILVFDSSTFTTSFLGSATTYVTPKSSSFTLQGVITAASLGAATLAGNQTFAGINTFTSSLTVVNAVGLGTAGQAVTISSNAFIAGTTFYQGGNVSIGATLTIPALSASLPVKTDATRNLTASAINVSGSEITGILAAADFPALTGDITTSAGAVATTAANTQANIKTFTSSVTVTNTAGVSFTGPIVGSSATFSSRISVSSNTVLAGTTFYQNGNVTIGTAGTVTIISSNAFIAGTTFYQAAGIAGQNMTLFNSVVSNTLLVSSSPTGSGQVSVSSTPATAPTDFLLLISSHNATPLWGAQLNGHTVSSGTTPTITMIGGTGIQTENNSTDEVGRVTCGSPVTKVIITYGNAYAAAPYCLLGSTQSTASPTTYTTTGSTFTFSGANVIIGSTYTWRCSGGRGG